MRWMNRDVDRAVRRNNRFKSSNQALHHLHRERASLVRRMRLGGLESFLRLRVRSTRSSSVDHSNSHLNYNG